MDHSMMERQAIILHSCHFPRQGIRHLLLPVYRVFDTGNLEIFTRWLLTCGSFDLVVISLQGQFYSMLNVLNLIGQNYPNCQILMMLDTRTYPKQEKYLERHENQVKVIEPCLPLPVFVQHLTSMRHRDGPLFLQEETVVVGKECLSGREVTLLSGTKYQFPLSTPEKTGNYYKYPALTEWGIKTVYALFAGSSLIPSSYNICRWE